MKPNDVSHMKLYEIPRNTHIKLAGDSDENVLLFRSLDGAYSYCTDMAGNLVHLAAYADVIVVTNSFTQGETK